MTVYPFCYSLSSGPAWGSHRAATPDWAMAPGLWAEGPTGSPAWHPEAQATPSIPKRGEPHSHDASSTVRLASGVTKGVRVRTHLPLPPVLLRTQM